MTLDRHSFLQGVPWERRRQVAAARDQILRQADRWDQLLRERDEALAELHRLRLKIVQAAAEREEMHGCAHNSLSQRCRKTRARCTEHEQTHGGLLV